MKKTLLALFFIAISCQLLLAQEKMYIKSDNGVNLREGAGTNYRVVKSIPAGSQVKVLSTEGEWAKVEYGNETGYVSNQFLSENKLKNTSSSSPDNNNQNNRSSSRDSGSSNNNNRNSSGNKSKSSSSASSYNRNWGIGLRAGDPAGITVKKYNGGKAWELNIGTTYYWGGYTYRDAFYKYDSYEHYRNVTIHSYNIRRALGIQLHHLWQKDLNIDGLSGLQWYYGLGGQIKSIAVDYRFRYEDLSGRRYDDVYDTAHYINLGVDGIIGLEYTFENVPLSIFTDINLFVEIYRNPFNIHPQGGLGIRYNF